MQKAAKAAFDDYIRFSVFMSVIAFARRSPS